MAQWFNKSFFSQINLLFNRSLSVPAITLKGVWQLKPDFLSSKGIEGVVFDVNQTLLPYNSQEVPPKVIASINLLRTNFKMCALSNYIGNLEDDFKTKRATLIENKLGLPIIRSKEKKPSYIPFGKAIDFLNIEPNKIAFVGDRIFTDILGANNAGMLSILVEPLDATQDPIYVAIPRIIEKAALRIILLFNSFKMNRE